MGERAVVKRFPMSASGAVVKQDQPLEGYDRVYIDDPFGNRIELMEPID
jgi:hypothetical protein